MPRGTQTWIGLVALILAVASGVIVFGGFDRLPAPALVIVVVPDKSLPDPLAALPTATPMPTPTPTATPIPTATTPATASPPLDVRVVSGTGGLPLLVRAQPGGDVIGSLPAGSYVVVTAGPSPDATGAAWYHVTQHGEQAVTGWVLGLYLAAAAPETGTGTRP